MNITGSEAPNAHTRMITAQFDTRAAAEKARADAVAAGLSGEAVKITDGHGTATGEMAEGAGVLDTIKSAFAPGERARQGFVVTAHVPDDHYEAVRDILGRDGRIADN